MELGSPPKDRCHMAYLIHFLLGVGMLLPWNAFITADSYFHFRFCGTPFENNFLSFFGVGFNTSSLIFMFLAVRYQHHIPLRVRVIGPLVIISSIFIVHTALVLAPVHIMSPNTLFLFTMITVVAAAGFGSFLTGAVFSFAAPLPPIYMQALMGGQGLAGIAVSISSVGVQWAAAPSTLPVCQKDYQGMKWSAFAYFMIETAILVLCTASFLVLEKLPLVVYYLRMNKSDDDSKQEQSIRDSAIHTDEEVDDGERRGGGGAGGAGESDKTRLIPATIQSDHDRPRESSQPMAQPMVPSAFELLREMGTYPYSVFMIFFVTLGVFPAVSAKISSSSGSTSRLALDLFVPLSFLNFNFFDFVGRMIPGAIKFHPRRIRLPICIIATLRLVFFALFILCYIQGSKIVVFKHDAFPVIFMTFFALSNGFCSSLSMMSGPRMVRKEYMGHAATVMAFFLCLGLMCGAATSFGLPLIVTK